MRTFPTSRIVLCSWFFLECSAQRREDSTPRLILSSLILSSLILPTGLHDYRLLASSLVLAIIAAALAAPFLRRMVARRGLVEASRKDDLFFRTLAESLPEMIWTADPDGMDDFFSGKWFEYTGMTREQSVGTGWTAALHPDDV